MCDFSNGIERGVNEDEYQAALQKHPDGLVVSLHRGRTGQFTLHGAKCETLYYDLAKKKQTHRSGKIIFRDQVRLDTWLATMHGLKRSDLNRCSSCSEQGRI